MGKKETPGMISRRELIVSGAMAVGGMLGLGFLASHNRNVKRGFPGTGAEAVPQKDDNMTFDPSRAPEKPLEVPPETPETTERKPLGQLPEALRNTLLTPEELKKNHITIHQPPNGTHLFLKLSVLELFPLFADAASGKVNAEIVLVDRPFVDWTAMTSPHMPAHIKGLFLQNKDGSQITTQSQAETISSYAQRQLQMYEELAATTTISDEDRKYAKGAIARIQNQVDRMKKESERPGMAGRYDFLIKSRMKEIERIQKTIETGKLPEAEIKEYMRIRDNFRTLLQILREDPIQGLDYYYGKEMNGTPVSIIIGKQMKGYPQSADIANKVFIIIAAGRDSNPKDSFLSPERVYSWFTPKEREAREASAQGQRTGEMPNPFDTREFTRGFAVRSAIARYDKINSLFAQHAALDSIQEAWARRLTGDEGGYPFVFVNPKNGVVTIE